MRRGSLVLALMLAALVLAAIQWRRQDARHHAHPRPVVPGPDVAPVCPWREPPRDLALLFAPATNYAVESRVLSRMTVDIEKRLGRHMSVDENPLRLHRVRHDGRWVGSVLVSRARAEHGAVEIVLGVETNGTVRGVLIQSHREPESIASVIAGANFLAGFRGKSVASTLQPGRDLPEVPLAARSSAEAIVAAVRDQLIVLSFAELPLETREFGLPQHH